MFGIATNPVGCGSPLIFISVSFDSDAYLSVEPHHAASHVPKPEEERRRRTEYLGWEEGAPLKTEHKQKSMASSQATPQSLCRVDVAELPAPLPPQLHLRSVLSSKAFPRFLLFYKCASFFFFFSDALSVSPSLFMLSFRRCRGKR